MKDSRKHVLLGIVTSIFLTPFVGGGLTAYLNRSGIRDGMNAGGYVGMLASVIVAGVWAVLYYVSVIQPATAIHFQNSMLTAPGGAPGDLWKELFSFVFLLLVTGVIAGMVGGGIGGYVAKYQRERKQKPTST